MRKSKHPQDFRIPGPRVVVPGVRLFRIVSATEKPCRRFLNVGDALNDYEPIAADRGGGAKRVHAVGQVHKYLAEQYDVEGSCCWVESIDVAAQYGCA